MLLLSYEGCFEYICVFVEIKFLISKDPKVILMCARRLRDTIEARTTVEGAGVEDIVEFLNSLLGEREH